jgi:preprotein translocase subunit YajC
MFIFLQSNSGGLFQFFPLVLMVFIIYFFFIRPQAKKQKEQKAFSNNLKKGDEVITSSGIVGRINKIEDGFIMLQVDQKTFIKVLESAVSKEMTDLLKTSEETK